MKELLLLVTVYGLLLPVQTINGVIWNKQQGNFVPIFSIPTFARLREETLARSRKLETHNFQGKVIKLTYFTEQNMIERGADNTKITGLAGEIWNTLSEYLNFTLNPVRVSMTGLGTIAENGSFLSLMGVIERNETDVIPKLEAYPLRLRAAQFTIPLWRSRQRLYIQREVRYDAFWMVDLFSGKVWWAIVAMYFLLSYCGFIFQTVFSKISRVNVKATIHDHVFYNFGMICSQSYIPENFSGRSRILELWLGLFSFLIKTAFSALLIGYMTRKIIVPPFDDIPTLVNKTSYDIIALSDSLAHIAIQKSKLHDFILARTKKRVSFASTAEEMYTKVCVSKKKYALIEDADLKKSRGLYVCRLNPIGISYLQAWISSGVSWKFACKKSIDIGILKLHEFGLIAVLKHRWLESKNIEEETPQLLEPINMEQTILIIYAFLGGVLISLFTLALENIFYCMKKQLA